MVKKFNEIQKYYNDLTLKEFEKHYNIIKNDMILTSCFLFIFSLLLFKIMTFNFIFILILLPFLTGIFFSIRWIFVYPDFLLNELKKTEKKNLKNYPDLFKNKQYKVNIKKDSYTYDEKKKIIKDYLKVENLIVKMFYYLGIIRFDFYFNFKLQINEIHFRPYHPFTWLLLIIFILYSGLSNMKEVWREMFTHYFSIYISKIHLK